ncbi:HPP family protein [Vibrio profundum]|uniref:HPP family protein n=1 Tax=Vibrio profundum TaxID=2910247 RepID=UPI003D0F6151
MEIIGSCKRESSRSGYWELMKGFLGGVVGILALSELANVTGVPWLMAPFGATCVILFAAPHSPFARPRNVVIGHLITAVIGLVALYLFGRSVLVMSIAVGVSIAAMQYFRIVHPPAGANPLVIILAGRSVVGFEFLVTPVLVGSVMLVGIAFVLNNGVWGQHWWRRVWQRRFVRN